MLKINSNFDADNIIISLFCFFDVPLTLDICRNVDLLFESSGRFVYESKSNVVPLCIRTFTGICSGLMACAALCVRSLPIGNAVIWNGKGGNRARVVCACECLYRRFSLYIAS